MNFTSPTFPGSEFISCRDKNSRVPDDDAGSFFHTRGTGGERPGERDRDGERRRPGGKEETFEGTETCPGIWYLYGVDMSGDMVVGGSSHQMTNGDCLMFF